MSIFYLKLVDGLFVNAVVAVAVDEHSVVVLVVDDGQIDVANDFVVDCVGYVAVVVVWEADIVEIQNCKNYLTH